MINVFIPYSLRRDKYNDLKYVLRSIDTNLPERRIIIFGDDKPKWIKGVEFIEVQRWYPKKAKEHWGGNLLYECYFDTCNKLKMFCEEYSVDNFIYTYDDIFFVRKIVNELQLKTLTNNIADSKIKDSDLLRLKKSRHGKTIIASYILLKKRTTKDIYDYENHSPRYYDRASLEYMFNRYKIEKQIKPYAIATLYYNLFFRKPFDVFETNNVYTHGYGKETYKSEDSNFKDKWFLNVNLGIREPGVGFLEVLFPNKSRYEK